MLDSQELARRLRVAMASTTPKITNAVLAAKCGVTDQAVTGWLKTGRVHKKHLPTIAEITGKQLSFFLMADQESQMLDQLTNDERELVQKYRVLSPRWKLTVQLLMQTPAIQQEEVSQGINVLIAEIFGRAVPDHRVEAAFGTPLSVHEPSKSGYKAAK